MNIGQAAKASGVSAKMIRYYEAIRLMRPAARTAAGYRIYAAADVHTLRFIRRARDLGFTVESIAELLALWQDRARQSADVKRLALGHIEELERRIAAFQGMVATLSQLAACCHGDDRPDCPILADLAAEEAGGAGRAGPRFGAAGGPAPPRHAGRRAGARTRAAGPDSTIRSG
jgi:MerR family gold-responsive transcriptional activator of gol and ges genes